MTKGLVVAYAVAMGGLGVGILALPAGGGAWWGLAALLSVAGVAYGTWRRRPAVRGPWVLLGAAVVALGAGDVAYATGPAVGGGGWPAVADLLYLATFPLLTVALLQLTGASTVLRDRTVVIDLLALACAAGLVGWAVVLGSGAPPSPLPALDRSLVAVHVLGSVVVVVVTAALLVVTRGRNASVVLLTAGSVGMLLGDAAWALAVLTGTWHEASGWELGYLLCYAAWGAASWPPAMTRVPALVEPRRWPGRGLGRVPMVTVALTGPAVLVVGAVTGGPGDAVVIAAGSALMTGLVVTRLSDAVTAHRRAVERARLLRVACGQLGGATDADAVARTLRAGIDSLMPRPARHRVVSVTADGQTAVGWEPWVAVGHRLPHGGRHSRLTDTRLLHPALQAPLQGSPATLVVSLDARPAARRAPAVTAVAIGAEGAVLAARQDILEVLVGQAAMAWERVASTVETQRRDRREYLTAVSERAAGVVILLDEDEWVRYASQSTADLLKVSVPVLATWRDIIHRDDQPQANTPSNARGPAATRAAWTPSGRCAARTAPGYRSRRTAAT
jgi:PAS domain-containing protein